MKETLKRLTCMLLALIMVAGMFPVSVFAEETENPISVDAGSTVSNVIEPLWPDEEIVEETGNAFNPAEPITYQAENNKTFSLLSVLTGAGAPVNVIKSFTGETEEKVAYVSQNDDVLLTPYAFFDSTELSVTATDCLAEDPAAAEAVYTVVLSNPDPDAPVELALSLDQTQTVNGIVVTVKAEERVFPADAVLSVTEAEMDEPAEAAVTAVRDQKWEPVTSSAVEIKITDIDGELLLPADGHSISISLSPAEPASEQQKVAVYRLTKDEEGTVTAEEQPAEENGISTAEVKIDSSLLYVVEWQAGARVERELSAEMGEQTVTVKGRLPEDAELVVVAVPLDKAAAIYEKQTGQQTKEDEIVFAYDVSILSGGEKYDLEAFGDSITVSVSNAVANIDAAGEEDAESVAVEESDTAGNEQVDVLHVKVDVTDGSGGLDEEILESLITAETENESLKAHSEGSEVFFDSESCSLFIAKGVSGEKGGSGQTESGLTYEWNIAWDTPTGSVTEVEYLEESNTLSFHPTEWKSCQAVVKVELRVSKNSSGDSDDAMIPAGALKFTLPAHVFYAWDQSGADTVGGLAALHDKGFDYSYDSEGNLVLTNWVPQGSGTFDAEISYTVDPLKVNGGHPIDNEHDHTTSARWWDDYTDYYQNSLPVSFSFVGGPDGTPEVSKDTLKIEMKTRVMSAMKADPMPVGTNSDGLFFSWQDVWGEKPENAEDYYYIVWNLAYGRGTSLGSGVGHDQPFTASQGWEATVSVLPADNKIIIDGEEYPGGEYVASRKRGNAVVNHNYVETGTVEGYPYRDDQYYTTASSPNSDTQRLVGLAQYNDRTTRNVGYDGYLSPRNGYISLVEKENDSSVSASLRYSPGTHFAILMRYPKSLFETLSLSEKYGPDFLKETGFDVKGTFTVTEHWDSGYAVEKKFSSGSINVTLNPVAGGGIFNKGYGAAGAHAISGGRTILQNGYEVTLNRSTSPSYGYSASWAMTLTATSGTIGDQLLGQHIVITDTSEPTLYISSNKTTNYASWTPGDQELLNGDEGDYEIRGFWFERLEDYPGTYSESEKIWAVDGAYTLEYSEKKPVYIYVRRKGDPDFTLYCTCQQTGAASFTVKRESDGATIPKEYGHYALPDDTVQIRMEYDSPYMRTIVKLNVGMQINPTERVKGIMAAHEAKGASTTFLKDVASYKISPPDTTGLDAELLEQFTEEGSNFGKGNALNDAFYLTSLESNVAVEKEVLVPGDLSSPDYRAYQDAAVAEGYQVAFVHLKAQSSARIQGIDTFDTDWEDPYKLLKGTFYELLPPGTSIQEGSIFGMFDMYCKDIDTGAGDYLALKNGWGLTAYRRSLDYTLETTTDPATGQQLVAIHYEIEDPDLTFSTATSNWINMVHFYFIIENPLENIEANGRDTMNPVGFVNSTPGAGHPQTGTESLTNAALGPFEAAFTAIAENNAISRFNKTGITWNRLTATATGFTKTVATPETLNSLPLKIEYESDAHVTLGNPYVYRLRYNTESDTKAEDIVFYDILDRGTTTKDSAWQGKFVSIDTSQIAAIVNANEESDATCAPVVYYSTTLTERMAEHGDYYDLANTSLWSTVPPADPAEVTAVAVDCRKDSNGGDFVLDADSYMYIFIHMQAPTTLQEGKAINGAVISAKPFEASLSGGGETKWLIHNAEVELRDVAIQLDKASDPKTGTPEARTIVSADGTGTIDYRLILRSTGEFDYTDVIITDPLPEGLTVDKIEVGLNGAAPKAIASVPGISYVQNGRELTFTIARQHPTVLAEDGAVVTDKDTKIYIYTKVDELKDADGNQIFLRDYDNTATLVSANGKPIGENTETTYHRAETTKVDVEKIWDDSNDLFGLRPEQDGITLNLTGTADIGSSSPVTVYNATLVVTPDENGAWAGSFEHLPKYYVVTDDASYEEPNTWYDITWSVTEEPITDSTAGTTAQPLYFTTYSPETGSPDEDGKVTVTNKLPMTDAEIKVKKVLNGRDWTDNDSFTFTLEAAEGTPMPGETKITITKADGDQTKSFGAIQFMKAGEYTYTVKETKGSLGGITYDETEHPVTFKVVIDADGNPVLDNDTAKIQTVTITNTYEASGKGEIKVKKELNGREWTDDDSFTFTLTAAEGTPMPDETEITIMKADEDQTKSFGDITFTKPGTYTYTVKETKGSLGGMTYDETEHTVTIKVKDDGNGNLVGDGTELVQTVTITNTYNNAKGNWTPKAKKILSGRALAAGEFTFVLEEYVELPSGQMGWQQVTTGTDAAAVAGAEALVDFSKTFYYTQDDVGDHKYRIYEQSGSLAGVIYDSHNSSDNAYEITVNVALKNPPTDELDVVPSRTGMASYEDPVFNNTYETTPTDFTLEVIKSITGVTPPNNDAKFYFKLTPDSGNPAGCSLVSPATETVYATAVTTGKFSKITFSSEGVFKFTVKELGEEDGYTEIPGYTYDKTPKTIQLKVEDVSSKLTITAVSGVMPESLNLNNTEGSITIINPYTQIPVDLQLKVKKTVSGDPRPGEEETFTFTLTADLNNPATGCNLAPNTSITTTAKGNDESLFRAITFTEEGEYNFTVVEQDDHVPGYHYDTTPKNIKVVVTDKDSQLTLTVTGADPVTGEVYYDLPEFKNEYHVTPTDYTPEAKKVIEGNDRNPDHLKIFTVELKNKDGYANTGAEIKVSQATVEDEGNFEFVLPTGVPGAIHFTAAGTYYFTLKETLAQGSQEDGYTYDTKSWDIKVVVEDKNSQLVATASYLKEGTEQWLASATFTNKYEPKPAYQPLQARKKLTGEVLYDAEHTTFKFELSAVTGKIEHKNGYTLPAVTEITILGSDVQAGTDGETAQFGDIEFTEAGDYYFRIWEDADTNPRITYDPTTWEVLIKVIDDGSGTLKIDGKPTYTSDDRPARTSDTEALFSNNFNPGDTYYTPQVEKFLDGEPVNPLFKETFYFELTEDAYDPNTGYNPVDGAEMGTTATYVIGDGEGEFGKITFKSIGTYTFRIQETGGSNTTTHDNYTYDDHFWTLTVKVKYDTNGDLELDGEPEYVQNKPDGTPTGIPSTKQAEFTNTYTPIPTSFIPAAKKEITGQKPIAGETFEFTLTVTGVKENGSYLKDDTAQTKIKVGDSWSKTIVGPGTVYFDEIEFCKAGEYKYTITETQHNPDTGVPATGYDYDGSTWEVTVKVTDTGGQLEADVGYKEGERFNTTAAFFDNPYTPNPVKWIPKVLKKMSEDSEPIVKVAKQFYFKLVLDEADPVDGCSLNYSAQMTANLVLQPGETQSGPKEFGTVQFTKPGTYTFLITEDTGTAMNFVYDPATVTATVTVVDDPDDPGNLICTVNYVSTNAEVQDDTVQATFINKYVPDPTSYEPPIKKTIKTEFGPTAKDMTFNFTLTAAETNPKDGAIIPDGGDKAKIELKAGESEGTANFGNIKFVKAGTYVFEAAEVKESEKGITYDETVWTLTVVVTDMDGYLEVTGKTFTSGSKKSDSAAFENPYKPDPTYYQPQVKKELDLITGAPTSLPMTFTFELEFVRDPYIDNRGWQLNASEAAGGVPFEKESVEITVPAGEIPPEDSIPFSMIHFTRAGVYTYRIREQVAFDLGMRCMTGRNGR